MLSYQVQHSLHTASLDINSNGVPKNKKGFKYSSMSMDDNTSLDRALSAESVDFCDSMPLSSHRLESDDIKFKVGGQ